MKKIKVVLVDDEILVLNLLRKRLLDIEGVEIIGEFVDAEMALEAIPKLDADIVFLDVEMPEMNGIELAGELLEGDKHMEIVFVTAYGQYAVEAFKLNALHYILKPVDSSALVEAIDRIRAKNIIKLSRKEEKAKIYLFGDVHVAGQNDKKVNWITTKSKELFALLMVHQEFGVNKWTLLETLWPNSDSEKAHQNLYTTVFRLKRSLGEVCPNIRIENADGHYRLILEDIFCDWYAFKAFIEEMPVLTEKTVLLFEKALDLYTEDLFGKCDWLWSIAYREKCYGQYASLVVRLMTYYRSKGCDRALKRLERRAENILLEEDFETVLFSVSNL